MASMSAFEAIRTLLAVRSCQARPVPDAVVRRILEAGRLTGSGMNGQPWHFIVVRDGEMLRRLGAPAASGPYVAEAPLAIAVATDRSRFAVSDASRAIQSMLLAAWAEGVGSNWAILPFGYPARPGGRASGP
jgi:nitroreductase